MSSSSSDSSSASGSEMPAVLVQRACTACSVLLDSMEKRLQQEHDGLKRVAAIQTGTHQVLSSIISRLDEVTSLREHIAVYRDHKPPPLAPNGSGIRVHVSMLAILLRILGTWTMSTGTKGMKWIQEAKQLLPLLLMHTTAVEICRDQIPTLIFRVGAFDLLPSTLTRAKTADPVALESLRAVTPDAAPPTQYLDILYSRIAWMFSTIEGHFFDQRGCLFLVQDGVIDPKLPFQLRMGLALSRKTADVDHIAFGSTTTLHAVFNLYHSSKSCSPGDIEKIKQIVHDAPRNIVEQFPAVPPALKADAAFMLKSSKLCNDFMIAMEVICGWSSDVQTETSRASSSSNSASRPSAAQNDTLQALGKPTFSVNEELASLVEYCRVGSHRLAVDQAMDVLFSDASDIFAIFNNYAHVLLNTSSAQTAQRHPQAASASVSASNLISEQNAARSAAPYLLFLVALQPYGHSDSRISKMIGKAWARLTIALQRVGEMKSASFCWQMAADDDCSSLIPSTTTDAIIRKLGEKQITTNASEDNSERFDHLVEVVVKHALFPNGHEPAPTNAMVDAEEDVLLLDSVAKCKERGNKCVLEGKWPDASMEYNSALKILQPCAQLITRIAQCFSHHAAMRLSFGRNHSELEVKIAEHGAVSWSMAALLLTPHDLEAHATYTRSIMELGFRESAVQELESFKGEIAKANTLSSAQHERWQKEANDLKYRLQHGQLRTPAANSDRPFSERDLELLSQRAITVQSVADQRKTRREKEFEASQRHEPSPIDTRVTSLQQEFVRYCQQARWPLGISPRHVSLMLEYATERAKVVGSDDVAMPEPLGPEDDDPEKVRHAQQLFIHRLTAMNEKMIMWWATAKPGDHTFPVEHIGNMVHAPYSQNAAHLFSNFISWPTRLHPGQTHVAVGFVDLGQLRTIDLAPIDPSVIDEDVKDDSMSDVVTSTGPPAQWIGFELVSINVAKYTVLLHMLQQEPTTSQDMGEEESDLVDALVDDCMLVWYSATWSPRTLRRFRDSLEFILTSSADLHPDVRAVLDHWSEASLAPLPLRSARTLFKHDTQWHEWLPNIALEADRMAVCSYGITRDLLPPSEDWVASVTWFQLPPRWYAAPRETVFNVVPLADLLRLRDPALGGKATDVVQACVTYLREGIHHARNLLRSGRLVARVELGRVELGNSTSRVIESLRPSSISWSNLVDYQRPKDFHALLRQVSTGRKVTHSMYSMNYTRGIKGTYYVDYQSRSKREKMLDQCLERWRSLGRSQTPFFQQLLNMPPIENRWNLCCWPLATHFYRKWLEAFFAADRSGVQGLLQHVRVVQPPYFYFMGRNNVTISLEYQYPL